MTRPTTTSTEKIDALDEDPVLAGQLAHAMRAAQRLIHETNKMCHQQQVTGLLRRMPILGIETIDIIMRPKLQRDLTNNRLFNFPGTELATYLVKKYKAVSTRDNAHVYTLDLDSYTFRIIMVFESWEMPVAQILHTGPTEFTKWLSTETERDDGAMPWGYYFKHYTLIDNGHKRIPNIKEEKDVFEKIGYGYISLMSRFEGNGEEWSKSVIANTS